MKKINYFLIALLLTINFYCTPNSDNVLAEIQNEYSLNDVDKFAILVIAKNDCFNCYKGYDKLFYSLKEKDIPVIFAFPKIRDVEIEYILQNNIGITNSDNLLTISDNYFISKLRKLNLQEKEKGKTFLLLVKHQENKYQTNVFYSNDNLSILDY